MHTSTRVELPEHEAYSVVSGLPDAPIFLTCEHASDRFPAPWGLEGSDIRLHGTHWSYDLGAREIASELARTLDATAVLAEFSRLVVDPNREETSDTLFRDMADGEPIALNVGLGAEEREARIVRLYRPFHEAVDRALGLCSAPTLLSIHTFTPLYEGSPRAMEVGVLWNREDELAERMALHLERAGFVVARNEPWSGKDGLIYSAERHADRHGRAALELEVRQDRAMDAAFRAWLVPVVAAFFRG